MCALKLKKTINMIDHEYWVAEKHENLKKKNNKHIEIIMMLYTNETTRNAGQEPVYRERFQWDMEGAEKTGADVYAHVKLSRTETREELNEKEESVKTEVETNLFNKAEDIL